MSDQITYTTYWQTISKAVKGYCRIFRERIF